MIWLIILLSGLITYGMRFVFLTSIMPSKLPDWAAFMMKMVPIAVLSTIIIAEIFIIDGQVPPMEENPRFVSGFIALIVAYYTRSVLLTMASGLGFLWLLSFLTP